VRAGVEDFFERVADLRREGVPFAIATVVSRRGPVSSHMGDRALVFEDGAMEGFVGGSCSRDVVRRQALAALQAGEPRLVSIRPDAERDAAGEEIVVEMSCGSKGAVDVYIEPFVPARTVVVVGLTPVAEAAASLSRTLEYHVIHAVSEGDLRDAGADAISLDQLGALLAGLPPAVRARTGVVVATQGHYDEATLEVVLRAMPAYVGLVASRRRGAEVAEHLRAAGFAAEDVAAIRNPAGLDLGARHPGEVALSILAEVVELHPSPRSFAARGLTSAPDRTAVDPVCGMEVPVSVETPSAERDGVTFWFCCEGCRTRFLAGVAT
jgi:xanthine dehydrogenase accessory factor